MTDSILVIFARSFFNIRDISIECNKNDKVSDLLIKFLNTVNSIIPLEEIRLTFMSGFRILNSSENLSKTVTQMRIKNYQFIILYDTDGLLKRSGEIERSSKEDGPEYFNICDGLNLIGNCLCKNCMAYKKKVVHQFGFGIYDVINDIKSDIRPVCPMCKIPFIPTTIGFFNCYYEYYGKKAENDKIKNASYYEQIGKDDYIDYLKIEEKNMLIWISLKVKAEKGRIFP